MGRIKTQLVKRTTRSLLKMHGDEFKEDFNGNKVIVSRFADISSTKLRNTIAGYVTRLKKSKEDKDIE